MRDRLCRTFKFISGKVWNLLSESHYYGYYQTSHSNIRRGLGFNEETITDLILLEISKRQPYDVITFKFGKNYEAQEGADWEWWILSGSGIIGLRFQAKRLHFNNGIYEYTHLNYRKGNNHQVDILINNAQRSGSVPLYIFYNFWDIDYPFRNFISHLRSIRCCRTSARTYLGITMASAFSVRDLVHNNQRELSDVLRISWPIYCLACCSFSDLSKSVDGFIKKYVINKFVHKYEIKVLNKLPEEVYSMIMGEFTEFSPMYTSLVLDLDNPHEEVEKIKEILK